MILLTLAIALFMFTMKSFADFRCPVLEKQTSCTCREDVWWNNDRLTIVNCSHANLKTMPNLSSLSNRNVTKLLLRGNNISSISLSDLTSQS